jgi:formylglycine-generating enzyme required for sulfatase activity
MQEYLDYNDSTHRLEHHDYFLFGCNNTVHVASYEPNPYGLYNMVGNLSDMIQEEGIAMGGDWLSTGYNVRITSKKKYENGGAVTVGFRVYMEIVEY